MTTKVFLSHSSREADVAAHVSDLLRQAGLEPILDADRVAAGSSFIEFMERAITDSDYCLLLWSRAAAEGRWVKEEWQAAYYRSVMTGQSFLVIGRLEDYHPPAMVPRVWIDLFPELAPGIGQLVDMWQDDEAAAVASRRPVKPPILPRPYGDAGQPVYITSKVFGKTFPLTVDLSAPAALATDRVVDYLGAPSHHDFEGRIGVRYEYGLSRNGDPLDPTLPLCQQGVVEKSLLELRVDVAPFAAGEVVGEGPATTTYRGVANESHRRGYDPLVNWAQSLGLGY